MRVNRSILLSTLIVVVFAFHAFSQTSTIPDDAKARTAPFVFSAESQKLGEQIYQANCKSCHGDPGKANYAKLLPIPNDPASAEYQKNSDGEIFFILSNGKGILMPTFVNTLNEEQRWNVISYIRTFNKEYKQPAVKEAGEGVKTETAKLVLGYDAPNSKLWATVTDSSSGTRKPLSNVNVKLFVKRTFGNLLISQATTSNLGIAHFSLPNDIPGDSIGNLILIAKTTGSNELTCSISEKLGVVTKPRILLNQRVWWSVNKMSPVWLILLYLSGIIGVGITVLFILLQLRKIKKINETKI